jgi:hypothetical protein
MTGTAVKASAVVGAAGKVELVVPLPPGTPVEVIVFTPDGDACHDLAAAAGSSTAFWDNPIDDEVWNAPGPG